MGAALSAEEEEVAVSLRKACEKGDHFAIARLLRTTRKGPGGPVDAVDWSRSKGNALSSSPAHYAARYGHDKCLELLLEHGADLGVVDFRGFSPVHEVCLGKRKLSTMVILVKKARCDVNAKNPADGWTAAHICAHDDCPELLEFIFKCGGYIDSRTRRDYATPLHLAAARRNFRCCEIALRFGASANELDSHGNPPLPSTELAVAIAERDSVFAAARASGSPPFRPCIEPNLLSVEYYTRHTDCVTVVLPSPSQNP